MRIMRSCPCHCSLMLLNTWKHKWSFENRGDIFKIPKNSLIDYAFDVINNPFSCILINILFIALFIYLFKCKSFIVINTVVSWMLHGRFWYFYKPFSEVIFLYLIYEFITTSNNSEYGILFRCQTTWHRK